MQVYSLRLGKVLPAAWCLGFFACFVWCSFSPRPVVKTRRQILLFSSVSSSNCFWQGWCPAALLKWRNKFGLLLNISSGQSSQRKAIVVTRSQNVLLWCSVTAPPLAKLCHLLTLEDEQTLGWVGTQPWQHGSTLSSENGRSFV